ncbi:GNAT family N-acetyltransferase [Mariniluteicoccus endophyticus]
MDTRPLVPEDAEASRTLRHEAFGTPRRRDDKAFLATRGQHWLGTFDGDRLVARFAERDYQTWFGGGLVPTSGLGSITVAAEHRRAGLLEPLMRAGLTHGLDRGTAISTFFPTVPKIYRRFGCEVIGANDTVSLPMHAVAGVHAPEGVRVTRAGVEDFETIRAVYTAWAREQNGPLSRTGPLFTASAEKFMDLYSGVTLAWRGDRCIGYCSWTRGSGYGDDSRVTTSDLIALEGEAWAALLAVLGSFSAVAGEVRIDTSGADLARYAIGTKHWKVIDSSAYMLKVLDPGRALSAITYAPMLSGGLRFGVEGDFLGHADGTWELEVSGGGGECRRTSADDAAPVFSARGLALWYAGAQSAANLRMAGMLHGGDPARDRDLDALTGGRQVHIRDYF